MPDFDLDGLLVLEPREVFDGAIVGVTDSPDDDWPRNSRTTVVVYSRQKCINAIAEAWEMEYEDAVEYFEFNTAGAWVGEQTPTFIDDECEFDDNDG